MSRSRTFTFTFYDEQEFTSFQRHASDMSATYAVGGKEHCPTTGKVHWQCYWRLPTQCSWNALKKKFPTAHIEIAKGTDHQNEVYCSKEKVVFTHGEPPRQGKRKDIDQVREQINEGVNMRRSGARQRAALANPHGHNECGCRGGGGLPWEGQRGLKATATRRRIRHP
eukprot:352710-Chlamydomonas_euryale.AAC.2